MIVREGRQIQDICIHITMNHSSSSHSIILRRVQHVGLTFNVTPKDSLWPMPGQYLVSIHVYTIGRIELVHS
jgi:uncharacterized protein YifN (PemK superfamily)